MSEAITVAEPTRTPRQPRETAPEVERAEPAVLVETTESAAEVAPPPKPGADPLAEMQAEMARVAAERDQERTARTRAEREAQRQQAGRIADRGVAVSGALESAKQAKAAAKAAVKAARESGDTEAELAALEQFNAASFREQAAATELGRLKAAAPAEPTSTAGATQEPAPEGGYTPQARAWIDKHPKFNTDPATRAAIEAAHGVAVADGVVPDSPAYFRALDQAYAALEKPSRGAEGGEAMAGRFNGAAPSRGAEQQDGRRGGVVQTAFGPVTVGRRADGKTTVHVAPQYRADFEEGAQINNMTLGDYIYAQVEIAQERSRGGNGGLEIREGEVLR